MNYRLILCIVLLLFATVGEWQTSSAEPPLPPVNQKQVCLECHTEFEQILKGPNVHDPLEKGKCSECHNPHASRHADLLTDDEENLCAKCHGEVKLWKDQPVVHDPVAQGRCSRCHDPHSSENANLLQDKTTELCASCHVYVRDWSNRPFVHDPVKKGHCSQCHNPHASGTDNLLKGQEGGLCLTCHQITADFTTKHRGFDPAKVNCSACHDPHAGDDASLIMKNKHEPFAEGDCNACHVATKVGLPLRGTANQICNDCHAQEVADIKKYSPHGATEQESCGLCHKPHAAHEKNLLAQSMTQLCTKCHDPAKGQQSVGDNPHEKFACNTCHAPHGSGEEAYLKQPNLQLCATCHSREHHVAHPMGEEVIDPISGTAVTCLSCHDLHAWKAEPLLPADAARDLCIRCHRDK